MNIRHWPSYAPESAVRAIPLCLAIWAVAGISAFAITTNEADTVFNSYATAYYSSSGTNGYFKNDQAGGTASFWMQAEEIECVIDAYELTSNANHKVMVVNLLNGFAKHNGTDWSSNIYNDDCMWASIAFARGYLACGNPRFKDIARWNFDMVFARAWDTKLGGGLYWTTDNRSKNACVNDPGGIAAGLLYQICGDASYLAKAGFIPGPRPTIRAHSSAWPISWGRRMTRCWRRIIPGIT